MLLNLYKADVIEGLQKAAGIIPQRTGAAYLRSIWLKAEAGGLEVLSTDSSIEFRGMYTAEVVKKGLVGVPGRSFVELLRRLPDGRISLKQEEGSSTLLVEQGRRKYKLPTNDSSWFQAFSDFPEKGAVVWSGDFLQEVIARVDFCIGDEGMDALACMILKPADNGRIEAAGMNGHQFAMIGFLHDDLRALLPEEGILIQKKYLSELKKWLVGDEIEVNIGDKRLYVRSERKKECFSMPLASFQYPDYSAFLARIKGDDVSNLELSRAEAAEALNRIVIFNTESNRCTYFALSAKEAVLSAVGQEVGSADESLDVEYNGSIERIAFPTGNMLQILDHFGSEKLTLSMTGVEGPCGMAGQDDPEYVVIIMPMKILEDVNYSEEQV